MGQSSCCSKPPNAIRRELLGKEFVQSINVNDTEKLAMLMGEINLYGLTVDSEIIEVGKNKVNALTYGFFIGSPKVFKFLRDKGASYDGFIKKLEKLRIDPIYYICEHGYLEFLNYYLPMFLDKDIEGEEKSDTLVLDSEDRKSVYKFYTPIQKACEKGNSAIVLALHKFFQNKTKVPIMFDLEKPCEKRGENCAMIACRFGHYTLAKALYKVCKCDFFKYNFFGENALVVCVSGLKHRKSYTYFDCISFLIETVKIDVTYMYEEILLLLEDEELVIYYENKLSKAGVKVQKQDVEAKYRFGNRPVHKDKYESEDSSVGCILKDITIENKASVNSQSAISSIIEMPTSFISQVPSEADR